MKPNYAEKYRDPRWQMKRLRIMERDNATCQECCEPGKHLNVHHLYYVKNRSLFLDTVILLQTARVVLWPEGVR